MRKAIAEDSIKVAAYYIWEKEGRPHGRDLQHWFLAVAQLSAGLNQLPTASFTFSPANGEAPLEVTFDGSGSTDPDGTITDRGWDFGDGGRGAGVVVKHTYLIGGTHSVTLTVTDNDGAKNSISQSLTVSSAAVQPDTPIAAPALDQSVATDLFTATKFLYTGNDPIQTGVADGIIEPRRAAVLRGRVLARDGQPVSRVKVSILNHPDFGSTATRTDGQFDLAVNGGGQLTVRYAADGHFLVQRQVIVPWQDYVLLPDVVLIAADEQVSSINLSAGASLQVARSSRVSDGDGERQATLLFPEGTSAEMTLPDGSTRALENLQVRATEYTVGPSGPAAMPGELPATSGYTYAVEFSVDEAITAGATEVRFNRPLIHYVENFVTFPVGTLVPVASYDREKAGWIPSNNGRVIQVLDVADGLAKLDLDGSGVAADAAALAALDISEAEGQQLASLYQPGQSLWRVPILHLSAWDCNWPYGPPADAVFPDQPPPEGDDPEDDPCIRDGSVIEAENQILGEKIGITGTPFALHYSSDRIPGRLAAYTLDISLSRGNIPATLTRIDLEIAVAGRRFIQTFAPAPDQRHTFTWDGRDAFGRSVQGAQPVRIRIGYAYRAIYLEPEQRDPSFALSGLPRGADPARQEITLAQNFSRSIGAWDGRGEGLGGWSLNAHHAYDPSGRILHLGKGGRHSSRNINDVITTVAGNMVRGFSGDRGSATEATIGNPHGLAVGPEGSLYIADTGNRRVRRVHPDGTIDTVVGDGTNGSGGDGGPATEAQLSGPEGVAIGPDGSLFIADAAARIRRVGPAGIITTVAGGGVGTDGGSALEAKLGLPRAIAIAPDGSIYIADSFDNRIRRVGPDGIITTVAGTGQGGFDGDGGPANRAKIASPFDVTLGPDGSLYIADVENNRVRRVGVDGIITTVAGTGQAGFTGDSGLATQAQMRSPAGVAIGPDGRLYVADLGNKRVRRVGSDGIITTVAGSGEEGDIGDGGAATDAVLFAPIKVAIAPDGSLYIGDDIQPRVRRVAGPLPGFSADAIVLPSNDARWLYEFDSFGRHLRTVNSFTGALVCRFDYDDAGRLTAIEDGDGNVTRIERGPDNAAIGIIAPFGQRTRLVVNADGYLNEVANPAGERNRFEYTSDGKMTSLTDAKGNIYRFTYDDLGRLIRDEAPDGVSSAFVRSSTDHGYRVNQLTASLREFAYLVEHLPTGESRRVKSCCGGMETVAVSDTGGSRAMTYPDSTSVTREAGPDPRFGMLTPVLKQQIYSTPGGLTSTMAAIRAVALSDPQNRLTVATLTDTLDVNGRKFVASFDAPQRQLTISTPGGRQHVYSLDEQGRIRKIEMADLEPVTFAFDAHGRLVTAAQLDRIFTNIYDSRGRLEIRNLPNGTELRYAYDDADRLIRATLASGRVYSFVYDKNNNLAELTTPSGAVHSLTYTSADVTEGYRPPGNDAYEFSYDQDRLPMRSKMPSGRVLKRNFDHLGRLVQQNYPEATVEYVYDVAQRLTKLSRSASDGGQGQEITFDYDGGMPIQMAWSGPVSGRFRYRYDNNFFLTGITLDDEPEIVIGRDADGMLIGRGPFSISRQGPERLASLISDGIGQVTLGYDKLGRLITRTYTVDGQQIYQTQLTYDIAGRIVQKRETTAGSTDAYDYTFDVDGQLTETKRNGAVVEKYQYDENGNRISKQLGSTSVEMGSYDLQDRLVQQGSATYQFDADGFLIQRGADTFQYSTRGELLRATVAGQTISYTYDGTGRQVRRTSAGGTHQFLYGNPSDRFQVTHTRGPDGSLTVYYYDTGGLLLAVERGGRRHYVATDHLGTPRVISEPSGTVVKFLDYDSFGGVNTDSNPGFDLLIGFAGGLTDRVTGAVRFGWRDYEPATGRWMAKDPNLIASTDLNLYRYVLNDPINLSDPTGLEVYTCSKPLDALGAGYWGGGGGRKSGPDWLGVHPLHHEYICVKKRDGTMECGGQSQESSRPWGPGAPSHDEFVQGRCEKILDDTLEWCWEDCLLDQFALRRPYYGLFGRGSTDCQEWASSVMDSCAEYCQNHLRFYPWLDVRRYCEECYSTP